MRCSNSKEFVLGVAVVKGITCWVSDARNVIRGEYVNGICQHDIDVIGGLVNAYELMFKKPVSFGAAERYNWFVEHRNDDRASELRAEPMYISGCEYDPLMPSVEAFDDIVGTAYDAYDFSDDRAVFALLHCAKRQFFCDGNKRTAQVVANHILAHDDAGCLIVVPTDMASTFLDDFA